MTTTLEVAAFVDLGVECWHQGTLFDALEILAARLDMAGCGELLTEAMRLEWTPPGASGKGNPHPTPQPKPPADPKPEPKP